MSSHRSAVRTGSRPESGSSKSTMSGSSTSARANPARLRMPPESSLGILSAEPSRPTSRRRRLTISPTSSSLLSVCWRSGKATLSHRFIEPKSAPSWKRTPNFLRISKSSSSRMPGTDSPCTRTSPSSGYSRPTMCLMHTDFPVPEGPRIIEILSSGMPRLSPRRIWLRPNALCTSTNSTASSPSERRFSPVCHWYSSASWSGRVVVSSLISSSDGRPGVGPPEDLRAEHPDEVHEHDVQDHGLRGRGAHPDGAAGRRVAVVTADEHDHRRHRHALDDAVEQVGWVLEHPEDQRVAARRHLPDLLHHRQVGGEEAGADPGQVDEGQHEPRGQQPGRAQERHRADAHDLQRVDLVRDPHGAELGDDAGAHLGGHHVAEGVRDQLAQVAPGGEHARVGGGAGGPVEVGGLDAALQADDERQAPDDEGAREDQHAGLAQRLAEVAEDLEVEDLFQHGPAEAQDLPEGGEPVARDGEPTAHCATRSEGFPDGTLT